MKQTLPVVILRQMPWTDCAFKACRHWRWSLPLLIALTVVSGTEIGGIVRDTIAEAYLQVSVFVAATLMLLYAIEKNFAIDLESRLANARLAQVPFAALLGLLPGCGGAIVVVTQFVNGRIRFGALVAVLIATMGDAAFLLIAAVPETAGIVLAISVVCAIVCGWIVDVAHSPDFMRQVAANRRGAVSGAQSLGHDVPVWLDRGWLVLWAAGVPFALAIAFQQEPNDWFGPMADHQPVTWLGFAGAMLAMVMWAGRVEGGAMQRGKPHGVSVLAYPAPVSDRDSAGLLASSRQARPDTNFVTVWVIVAFLSFELSVAFSGTDPRLWFNIAAPLMPLVGMLVGFIPGCGPQILLTSLYLSGAVPLSTLLANAISNDGDALFPALALAPRASLLATLYSAVPALLVGYVAFSLGY